MVLPVEGVFHNLVIVKIKKEYPGQAMKVMHSLWGAGQMMFTKFMIVVDGDVDIHNYEEVARYISKNTNPAADIHFTQGPVDVLDHSCSVMAFGGKMGIDATRKFPDQGRQEKEAGSGGVAGGVAGYILEYRIRNTEYGIQNTESVVMFFFCLLSTVYWLLASYPFSQ